MATPTIPALLDPTAYAVTLTPGTYADLVAGTLGNTADSSDGFEAKLSESAARHQAMLDTLPALDADVLALGTTAQRFDAHPGADMARQLQPVSDALDVDVAAFVGVVLPQGPPAAPAAPISHPVLPRPIMGGPGTVVPGTGPQVPRNPLGPLPAVPPPPNM